VVSPGPAERLWRGSSRPTRAPPRQSDRGLERWRARQARRGSGQSRSPERSLDGAGWGHHRTDRVPPSRRRSARWRASAPQEPRTDIRTARIAPATPRGGHRPGGVFRNWHRQTESPLSTPRHRVGRPSSHHGSVAGFVVPSRSSPIKGAKCRFERILLPGIRSNKTSHANKLNNSWLRCWWK